MAVSETKVSVFPDERLRPVRLFIEHMPSLSTTVKKVLGICNNPETPANDLNRVISLDPVLAGQVLRLINSAYYSLPKEITSLTRAIIMLGLNTVKNLALSTAALGSMGKKENFQALSADAFWFHAVSAGVTAKCLAVMKQVALDLREEYFLSGLMHDLGKIPLNVCFPEEYLKASQMASKGTESIYDAERAVLGIDHCVVGALIIEKWGLSDALNNCLRLHHSSKAGRGAHRQLTASVALANSYIRQMEAGTLNETPREAPLLKYFLNAIDIEWPQLLTIREAVQAEIEKAKIFLKLTEQ
jgi:HD-like signal output (HDOD) protein